ncbi:MAG: sigma-54-dependent Fis family transcriptional regulator [Paludibacteraceae bacterium]|nr:sigma-54-dependent Fis family transcriptional regulator [Paludibacteraceae bacterium]
MTDNTEIQRIKQRMGIIGNSPQLNRDIEIAVQVAPTDLTVLIIGESGVGKEYFPQIIHNYSSRKHGPYFAINCGAIPEGTIDSELFGHEKGAFTDAKADRKGYFEIADGGTLFLDEVGELPLPTQVRLLRVLETGEFIKVGSSKVQKTNVRVVAATNINFQEAISAGRFREDLYYRLNTIEIKIPALRERKADIPLLFRKFAADCAEKYRMPVVRLTPEATTLLQNYYWSGNIRQLKNIAEQISVVETQREISAEVLAPYLPHHEMGRAPAILRQTGQDEQIMSERELFYYKMLIELKKDMNELRSQVDTLARQSLGSDVHTIGKSGNSSLIASAHQFDNDEYQTAEEVEDEFLQAEQEGRMAQHIDAGENNAEEKQHESSPSTMRDIERETIAKALQKHNYNRKAAAAELQISERTLYRKIKEFDLQ